MAYRKESLKSQNGFSLIELSIYLAITSVGVVLALKKSSEELRERNIQKESAWVVNVLADLNLHKGSSSGYATVSDLTLGAIKSVPKSFMNTKEMGKTVVGNGFGGWIHVGPLSLGGVNNAYALTYSGIPRESCPKMVMTLYGYAKSSAPLYGIVGNTGNIASVPVINLSGSTLQAPGATVLMNPDTGGPDLAFVASFCDSVGNSATSLRSVTLVRRP